MENIQLALWQSIVLCVLYLSYLAWVMFGGLKKRKVKLTTSVLITLLMIYGVIHEFTGIGSIADYLNIFIVISVAFVKGIVLGKRKRLEKSGENWYMYHDGKYIVLWVIFFVLKTVLTNVLKHFANVQFPLWHTILYFFFYYPWRTANVFYSNPKMRKELLSFRR